MRKYMYIICLLYVATFVSCESETSEILSYGSISGKVLDSETYKPIEGALISTTPASITTLTDAKGEFLIEKVKNGDIAVNVKRREYLTTSLTIAIYENERTQMNFLIYKDENNIGNISIYDPVPGNGAVDQALALALRWKVEGNKASAELAYDIYIFESNSTVQKLLGENVVLKEVTTSGLKLSTTYYWYVVVKYNGNKVAFSPTWTFRTRDS